MSAILRGDRLVFVSRWCVDARGIGRQTRRQTGQGAVEPRHAQVRIRVIMAGVSIKLTFCCIHGVFDMIIIGAPESIVICSDSVVEHVEVIDAEFEKGGHYCGRLLRFCGRFLGLMK